MARHPEPRPPVEPPHPSVEAPRTVQWLGIPIGMEIDDREPAPRAQNPLHDEI
ncbi:MAG TPA: hypothetical protein VK386_08365 [Acidimicrobiales bacterium]|nr:hypothetical protein [Acidimicrobiales bacterium]